MRKTIAGILIGMFLGAATVVEGQNYFGHYYASTDLFPAWGDVLTDEEYYQHIRLGYGAGVVDALEFVISYGAYSKNSFEDDYKRIAKIKECLTFRGTTRGVLDAYASSVWRKAMKEAVTESAAAVLAISCSDVAR